MKIVLIIILSPLLFFSCQKEKCNCQTNEAILIENDSLIRSIQNEYVTEFTNYWGRFGEPILFEQNKESYRLSVTVLLSDYFKIYRVDNKKNQYHLSVKEYTVSTTTDFKEDSIVSSLTKQISRKEWLDLTNTITKNCYWTMPSNIKEDDGWLDGSIWSLEGFNPNHNCTNLEYHFITRTSPYATNDSSNFIKICEKLIELDSLVIKEF